MLQSSSPAWVLTRPAGCDRSPLPGAAGPLVEHCGSARRAPRSARLEAPPTTLCSPLCCPRRWGSGGVTTLRPCSAVIIAVLSVALTVFALADCVQTEDEKIKGLPKWAWIVLIVLLPWVGPITWLFVGKERTGPAPKRAAAAQGPDGPRRGPRLPASSSTRTSGVSAGRTASSDPQGTATRVTASRHRPRPPVGASVDERDQVNGFRTARVVAGFLGAVLAVSMVACSDPGDLGIVNEGPYAVTVVTGDHEVTVDSDGGAEILNYGCTPGDVTVEFLPALTWCCRRCPDNGSCRRGTAEPHDPSAPPLRAPSTSAGR